MKPLRLSGWLLIFQLIAAGQVSAAVIVDTGPGSGTKGETTVDLIQSVGAEFPLPTAHVVTEVMGWIKVPEKAPGGTETVSIYTDGGDVPGKELFSAEFNVPANKTDWAGASGLNWALDGGVSYWVVFSVRGLMNKLVTKMPYPSKTPLDNEAFSNLFNENGKWMGGDDLDMGVKILGEEPKPPRMPEPESLTLLLAGLIGLAAFRRRRRASLRGPVPRRGYPHARREVNCGFPRALRS